MPGLHFVNKIERFAETNLQLAIELTYINWILFNNLLGRLTFDLIEVIFSGCHGARRTAGPAFLGPLSDSFELALAASPWEPIFGILVGIFLVGEAFNLILSSVSRLALFPFDLCFQLRE